MAKLHVVASKLATETLREGRERGKGEEDGERGRKGLRERERERERERGERVRGEKGEWRERKDSSCKFCRNSTLQAKCRLRHKGPNEREEGGLRGREGRRGKMR